jgi:uncharacterized protein (TIGR02391 family)
MAKINNPEYIEANLSSQQMQSAIPKIERRITDLDNFDVSIINDRGDGSIYALEQQLDTLLVSIFGSNTVEYERYRRTVTDLDRAPMNMHGTPIQVVRDGLVKGISNSKAALEAIKKGFNEELEDAGMTSAGRTLKAYEGLELHPEIERAVGNLYKDGHYANAVEDATKALNALVRLRSGIEDKDGASLMEASFNPKTPILKFNSLTDQSDIDEQRGFMMMFGGAVAGLRNPRAHKIIKDDPEMALEFIAYISLLAKLVDKSTKSA